MGKLYFLSPVQQQVPLISPPETSTGILLSTTFVLHEMIIDATFVHDAQLATIIALCTDGASFISGYKCIFADVD